ncbi:prenyltransferase-like protein [Xylogone sp. PMI_703]|nr:prenyltransferase-like protein [Xylogone sp. PMI_703]
MGSAAADFKFDHAQFLEDVKRTAAGIGAPFNEEVTRKVLDVYKEQFAEGGIVLRTSNRGAQLDYRFFMRRKTPVMELALKEGFIKQDDELTELIAQWSALYNGRPEASGDFDSVTGLAKIWLYFGAIRPVDEILQPFVPEGIRAHLPSFKSLGLTHIQHVAVDYNRRSLNLYFNFFGETTPKRVHELVKLVQDEVPSDAITKQICDFLTHENYPFSVTLRWDGHIERVCFYCLRDLPPDADKVDPALTKFWDVAPCYDVSDFKTVGWSFGGKYYLKSERGYYGNIASYGEYWGVFPEE